MSAKQAGPITRLLNEGKAWCQRAEARGRQGRVCHANSPKAVKWCLVGALLKLYPEMEKRVAVWRKLEIKLDQRYGGTRPGILLWNDAEGRRWEDVAELLKEAGL